MSRRRSIFDMPASELQKFYRGGELQAKDLNSIAAAINKQNQRGPEMSQVRYPTPAGKGGGGVGRLFEVKIFKAVAVLADTSSPSQVDFFNANGPFVVVQYMLLDEGNYVIDPTQVNVFVPAGVDVARFKAPDGTQIFNADFSQPTFFVAFAQRGVTLVWPQGLKLIEEPDTAALCPPIG